MKKTLLGATLILVLSTPAMAAEKQENKQEVLVGLGSGAAVGALVGGPIGAFVGAFAGALIGEKEAADEVIEKQQLALADYEETRADLATMTDQNERLSARLSEAEALNARLEQARIDNLMAMTVQFRTGSSEIESHFAAQLNQLASLLKQQPGLELDLSGFADKRGAEEANLALSRARVEAVQAYLVKQGVPHTRLYASAYGEQQSLAEESDFEANFFDRRVTLNARKSQSQSAVASNR